MELVLDTLARLRAAAHPRTVVRTGATLARAVLPRGGRHPLVQAQPPPPAVCFGMGPMALGCATIKTAPLKQLAAERRHSGDGLSSRIGG